MRSPELSTSSCSKREMIRLALWSALLSSVLAQSLPAILVYHRTLEYYHESFVPLSSTDARCADLCRCSIPTAIQALTRIGSNTSLYTPSFTQDPLAFRSSNLNSYAAIIFLSNSEVRPNGQSILDAEGQTALDEWLGKGGALVGIHSGCAVLFNTRESMEVEKWCERY